MVEEAEAAAREEARAEAEAKAKAVALAEAEAEAKARIQAYGRETALRCRAFRIERKRVQRVQDSTSRSVEGASCPHRETVTATPMRWISSTVLR